MHLEILTPEQEKLLPYVNKFKTDFVLVGGTAIALHLGHRRSIDFDLFTQKEFDPDKIRLELARKKILNSVGVVQQGQLTLTANQVKMTWWQFEYNLEPTIDVGFARIPQLVTLGAMKLFALNQRAKWKDYVDLYVLFKHEQMKLKVLTDQAKRMFGPAFNEKLIREQLAYFEDIDYKEKVTWLKKDWQVSEDKIKKYLIQVSLS